MDNQEDWAYEFAELLKQARSWVGVTAIIAPNAEEARIFRDQSVALGIRIDRMLALYAVERSTND